jgi:gas vesicle protein
MAVGGAIGGGGIGIIAGAAIGGALMYLFDPKVGGSRRHQIRQAAHGAMDQGKDAIGAAIGSVASHAGHVADHLRSHLSDAGSSMAGMASDAANSAMNKGSSMAHDAASHLMNQAQQMRDNATDYANQQLRRIGNALPHDREHHIVGQTACAVGSLAIGAGAIYFLDPENGQRRRSEFRQRLFKTIRDTGSFFAATGRHLRDKMQGQWHDAQEMFASDDSEEQSSDASTPMSENSAPPQTTGSYSA